MTFRAPLFSPRPVSVWRPGEALGSKIALLTAVVAALPFNNSIANATPAQRYYDNSLRTWTQSGPLPPPGKPFAQLDWPNPSRGYPYPQSLRTWTWPALFTVGAPFRQREWPLPVRLRLSAADAYTWWNGLPPGEISRTIPRRQSSWPLPHDLIAKRDNALLTWISQTRLPLVVVAGKPFAQFDWPNPRAAPYPQTLRSYVLGVNLIPPPVVEPAAPSAAGVRHTRPPVIRLSDIREGERQSTAEFIKSHLRLPPEPTVSQPSRPTAVSRQSKAERERERLAEQAMRAMEIERLNEIRITYDNNALITLMLMSTL